MTVKGGTSPACAACKYQRRKCSSDCSLAPYFPANQPKMFQNVHRLFGVANVRKILDRLESKDQKEDAMKSVIYEAEMREKFPVHGCYAIIHQLSMQLHYALEELRLVYAQLSAYRQELNKPLDINNNNSQYCVDFNTWDPIIEDGDTGNNEMSFAINQLLTNGSNGFCSESEDNNVTTNYRDLGSSDNVMPIQAQFAAASDFGIREEKEDYRDYKDILFDSTEEDDDKQYSYIETKVSLSESSSESSTKQAITVEHVSQSELRTAAAYFSLTTVN